MVLLMVCLLGYGVYDVFEKIHNNRLLNRLHTYYEYLYFDTPQTEFWRRDTLAGILKLIKVQNREDFQAVFVKNFSLLFPLILIQFIIVGSTNSG